MKTTTGNYEMSEYDIIRKDGTRYKSNSDTWNCGDTSNIVLLRASVADGTTIEVPIFL